MDRMVLFLLKQDLLSYAINNNLIDDAVQYYTDLARMLNICLDTNTKFYNNHDCFACNKLVEMEFVHYANRRYI